MAWGSFKSGGGADDNAKVLRTIDSDVRRQLTHTGLRQLAVALPVGGLGSWVPLLMFAGVDAPLRLVWLVLSVATGLGGGLVAARMWRRPAPGKWAARLVVAPHMLGGLAIPLVFRPSPASVHGSALVAHAVVMVVVYTSLMAWDRGYALALLLIASAANPFIVSSLQPLSLLARIGASVAIGVIVAALAAGLHRALRDSIEFRLRNAELVGELRRANAELAESTLRDPLTGVANRRAFDLRLQQQVDEVGLLFVDVDHFKVINDTHGHAAGDEELMRVARALSGAVRENELVARLGGDEFAVLLEDPRRDELEALAGRVQQLLVAFEPRSTLSIGGTIGDLSIEGSSAVLGRVDRALYDAKRAGRNCVRMSFLGETQTGVANPNDAMPNDVSPDTVGPDTVSPGYAA